MKKRSFQLFITFSIFLIFSCTEWGETLTFEVVNNTNEKIFIIQIGDLNQYDTIELDESDVFKDISSEGTGNAPPYPFGKLDTLAFIIHDTITKVYTRQSEGKNPFDLEFYEAVSRTETKSHRSITYEYLIESADFE